MVMYCATVLIPVPLSMWAHISLHESLELCIAVHITDVPLVELIFKFMSIRIASSRN